MGHVGRFPVSAVCAVPFERGQIVVIQTDRGVELGEVLIALAGTAAAKERAQDDSTAPLPGAELAISAPPTERPHVIRVAGADDLVSAERAEDVRPSRFKLCQRVLQDGNWPWELIDVEPLLDGRATVLHYLGPHRLDETLWRARFRALHDLDIVLEPAGKDVAGDEWNAAALLEDDDAGWARCGCEGGGCETETEAAGTARTAGPASQSGARGCGSSLHAGCASCGISRLRADRGVLG
jgi:hypothetical protein